MARLSAACFLHLLMMLKIFATKSEEISDTDVHRLPYWIQDSLLDYADEIGDRNMTEPVRKIYRKDLDPNYVAYYEFQFKDVYIIFSSGPTTGDHRLVEEGEVPRTTDTLIAQAAKMNKVCQKFFRLNADGTTVCEDDTGKAVASTMDLRTLTTHVNTSTLSNDISEHLTDFAAEWKKLATEIHSSYEWKEMTVHPPTKTPSFYQRTTIYKVLTPDKSHDVPIGASDVSKLEVRIHLDKIFSKKLLSTLCLLLGNICSEDGKVDFFSILRKKKNLGDLNYIEIDVIDDYETFLTQLENKSIDFYLKLTVAGKFMVIRRFTISLRRTRNKRSTWSGTIHSIPYEWLMPDYDQHWCSNCGSSGCYSGCTPVAWAQIFAYYDRVAHLYGYRYSTSHWSGQNGVSGSSSYMAPGYLNGQVESYVESLRAPLGTFCDGTSGSTYVSNTNGVSGWFRQRQGSGGVITLSLANIGQKVSQYVKQGYPVQNSIWWYGNNKNTKSGHSVVVTKIKERSRLYKYCWQSGWWIMRRTKCAWKIQYEYEWYRRMGWGPNSQHNKKWYPVSARAANVAVV